MEKNHVFEGVSYTPEKVAKMPVEEFVSKYKGGAFFVADKQEETKLRAMHAEATEIVKPKAPVKDAKESK